MSKSSTLLVHLTRLNPRDREAYFSGVGASPCRAGSDCSFEQHVWGLRMLRRA